MSFTLNNYTIGCGRLQKIWHKVIDSNLLLEALQILLTIIANEPETL